MKKSSAILLAALLAAIFGGVVGSNLLQNPTFTTQGPLNLFVDPAGNDAGTCLGTGIAACATIQGAVNLVPKRIRHPVTVTVASTYSGAGAYVEGFSYEPGVSPTSGAYLLVIGTFTNFAPATGSATGTVTSATAGPNPNTWNTITVNGAGWTSSNLRGQLIE